ncbi:uncharacterized protein LOC131628563 [Vicia villosa]|uniref:uncharacterized protein LOC131628563 n=1 Tax=Vicia villosa TaxID=3911 RepID=UPI00273C10ED|nr:uncharacterized protein LOC131628563 [Vicia villosa]
MASNNEDSFSLDATVINKNDISIVVPPPRNTAPHPCDDLTASTSPKGFHDDTVHHLGDTTLSLLSLSQTHGVASSIPLNLNDVHRRLILRRRRFFLLRQILPFSPLPPSQFPKSTFSPHRTPLNPPKCTLSSENPLPQNAVVSKPSPLEILKTSSVDRYTKEKSSIIVIGLNVHTAPVEMREKLAIPEAQWPQVIQELCALNHIEEVVVLNTCNRIEIYLVALSQHRAVREVTDWISKILILFDPASLYYVLIYIVLM